MQGGGPKSDLLPAAISIMQGAKRLRGLSPMHFNNMLKSNACCMHSNDCMAQEPSDAMKSVNGGRTHMVAHNRRTHGR